MNEKIYLVREGNIKAAEYIITKHQIMQCYEELMQDELIEKFVFFKEGGLK